MTDKVVLKPITLLGRKIVLHTPNTIQLAMLRRVGIIANAAGESLETLDKDNPARGAAMDRGLDAVARALDLVEGLVESDDDREWLVAQMFAGKLDIDEVFDTLKDLAPQEPPKKAAKKAQRAL